MTTLEINRGDGRDTYDRSAVNGRTVIRSRAPLRISFVGGGTDLPQYYERYGGAVLSSTINRYARTTLHARIGSAVEIRELSSGVATTYRPEGLDGQTGHRDNMFGLVIAAIRRLGGCQGFSLELNSEVPRGSGLGGSSAVTAAVIGTIAEFHGLVLDRYELAELNYTVERLDLGIAGGKQDQYATSFGGFNIIEFKKGEVCVTPLRLPLAVLSDLEDHLELYYSGSVRPHLGIVAARTGSYENGDQRLHEGMSRMHQMVWEAKAALLRGKIREFGHLLDENMAIKRRMDPRVSTPHIDELYALARKRGAIGGKLLGAGGGGYLLLLVEGRRRFELRASLERAGATYTHFSFQETGLQVWRSQYH